MAHDFYKKIQELNEKYRKREIELLNAERKWTSALNKNSNSLPLQDFFQRIDRREKETEQTYQSIMKQIEDNDKHIDMMSLKLEKLRIFKNNLKTNEFANWSFPGSNTLSLLPENSYSFNSYHAKPNLQTISTQTEIEMHCQKCDLEPLENESPNRATEKNTDIPVTSLQSGMLDISRVSEHATITLSETAQNMLEAETGTFTYQSQPTVPAPVKPNVNGTAYLEQANQKQNPSDFLGQKLDHKKSPLVNAPSLPLELQDYKNSSVASNDVVDSQISAVISKNSEEIKKALETEDTVLLLNSKKKQRNNEFDFLESETPNISDDTQSQDNSNTLPSPKRDSIVEKGNGKSFDTNNKDKSDSSGSVNEPSAPENVLPGYNSDSFSEKDSPLKASAAYQALLGNAVPLKSNQSIPDSDSDTEDEVEKALSSAVAKPSKQLPISKNKNEKEDKVPAPHIDVKSPVRTNTTRRNTKPQLMLSNNTRKVLGLDTSSGSEVELAVETSKGKIEEDSDEFGFFD